MQQALDLPISPRYGFERFIPCPGNASAFQFARKVANPIEPENLLYIYGPIGCGKTHLLHSIGLSLPGGTYKVLSAPEIGMEGKNFLSDGICQLPALLVDDLELLPEHLKGSLWEAFNIFHQSGRPVALAGNAPPRELTNLDEHLISRLLWGLVARLDVSDDGSRLMLIAKLAADRQILLPEDVAAWLLTILPRDVGSLITACDELYKAALEQQRKITLRLARELYGTRTQ